MGHTLFVVPARFRDLVDYAYFALIVAIVPVLVFYFGVPLDSLKIPYFIGVGAIISINITIVCDILFAWWRRLFNYELPPKPSEELEITALIAAYLPNEKEMCVLRPCVIDVLSSVTKKLTAARRIFQTINYFLENVKYSRLRLFVAYNTPKDMPAYALLV